MPVSTGAASTAGRALGKYTLLGRLAQGGMGEILLARLGGAAGFEKYVVIKRLRRHLDGDERSVQAFLDEARIVARISHPNVCQVHELGVEGGRYYLAMEYLEGLPLSGLIRRANRDRAPLALRAVSGMIEQACEGLHHVHNLRRIDGTPAAVLHRDVSPQNLFVTVDGAIKILDFGIAKSGDSSVKTPTGRIKGKWAYVSPEQIRGAAIDQRSDIYSLGVVMYEAITGKPLFQRGDAAETFRAIRDDTLPFLRDVPGELNGVVQKAVARDPAQRFDSARALGRALAEAVAGLGGSMSPPQLAEWLGERFADDLRERRERIAQATGGGRAAAMDEEGERLEPGTVLFTNPAASAPSSHDPLMPTGTMALTAPSGEVWSEPAMTRAAPGAAAAPATADTAPAPAATGPLIAPATGPAATSAAAPAIPPGPRPASTRAVAAAMPSGMTPAGMAPVIAPEPRRGLRSRLAYGAVALLVGAAIGVWAGRGRPPRSGAPSASAAPSRLSRAGTPADHAAPSGANGTAAPSDIAAFPADRAAATAADPAAADRAEEPVAGLAAHRAALTAERATRAAARDRAREHAAHRSRARGYFTLDSMPYATVHIDGVERGITPLLRVPLAPGVHSVSAVTADGRRRSFRVKIQAGVEAPRRKLAW